jgi:Trypsin-like peptidase domain
VSTVIARPSVVSLFLELRAAGGAALGTATGFVVERDTRRYLITNWHVASGRRSDNGAVLSPIGAVPVQLAVLHNAAGTLGTWSARVEPLYDSGGAPRWREHPTLRRQVDVVALELTQTAGIAVHAHDPWANSPGIAVGVAQGVEIIGFPFGLTGGAGLGIWVRGSIATEPAFDYDNLPRFLVDSRTRPGQSGSPVLIYAVGGAVPMADGSTAIMSGAVEQFLGVYSGRINDQSDLGYVWKASVVREIVDTGVAGSV